MRSQIVIALLIHLVWAHSAGAVSATLHLQGTVPRILQATLVRESSSTYRVHEISNIKEGYMVTLETDATSVFYEGHSVPVINGYAVLTRVTNQERSVDVSKKLVLASTPSYLHISILPD